MTASVQPSAEPVIIYPDSDGQPMADNTKQFRCIVTIQCRLDALLKIIRQETELAQAKVERLQSDYAQWVLILMRFKNVLAGYSPA